MKHYNNTLLFSCVSVTLLISQMREKYFRCLQKAYGQLSTVGPTTFQLPSIRLRKFSFELFLSGDAVLLGLKLHQFWHKSHWDNFQAESFWEKGGIFHLQMYVTTPLKPLPRRSLDFKNPEWDWLLTPPFVLLWTSINTIPFVHSRYTLA